MQVGGVDDLLFHAAGGGAFAGEVDQSVRAEGLEDACFVQSAYVLEMEYAILVFHEFGEEVDYFHKS